MSNAATETLFDPDVWEARLDDDRPVARQLNAVAAEHSLPEGMRTGTLEPGSIENVLGYLNYFLNWLGYDA